MYRGVKSLFTQNDGSFTGIHHLMLNGRFRFIWQTRSFGRYMTISRFLNENREFVEMSAYSGNLYMNQINTMKNLHFSLMMFDDFYYGKFS